MTKRVEFALHTKRVVAERCAYRCCFPACNKLTIGPGARSNESARTGKASHIFSASPSGPRGQGSLTYEQLRSPENAIWLCSDHATLVDTNRGEAYPAEVLLSFKAFREAQVAREQGGIWSPIGWFHEMVVRQGPVFASGGRLRFGKVTLVEGANASGKSALCEWLSGLGTPSAMWRWDHPRKDELGLDLEITYFDPAEQHAQIRIADSGTIKYFINGREVPFYPLQVEVVRLPQYRSPRNEDHVDELEVIGEILGCHSTTIQNLVPLVNRHGQGAVRNINLRRNEGAWKVFAEHPGEDMDFSFLGKSDSQKAMILIEFCVAMARFSAEFMPTILLLDGGVSLLDQDNFSKYMTFLLSAEHHFQSIVMQLPSRIAPSSKPWEGWEFVRLIGQEQGVIIDQTPF